MTISLNIPGEDIENKIYLIRGQKVMLDSDLAALYQVQTKRLNEQVKRNADRFPGDFMFQLTEKEWSGLKSQFATSNERGGRRGLPYVFTEHGVLMLSSVLSSERAVQVNIRIMRIYIRIREMIVSHKDVLLKVEQLERAVNDHDSEIRIIFTYLKELLEPEQPARKRIGYRGGD